MFPALGRTRGGRLTADPDHALRRDERPESADSVCAIIAFIVPDDEKISSSIRYSSRRDG
jgi:hypothetical protein